MAAQCVEPADFKISYQTPELASSPRFTHRTREYKNYVRKKEATGFYIKQNKDESERGSSHTEDTNKPTMIDEIDLTEGKTRGAKYDQDEDRATMYEVYVDHDLEDTDESVNPVEGSDGIQKPYIITIDRDLQTVKRIQRNWKPDDDKKEKRLYFTHYRFTPGLGFYGYGFLHLIGDMSITATGTLRSLLDAAAFANMPGGFKTRDARIPGNSKPLQPGEWREVNSSGEDLKNGFFSLPYKEPSNVLYQLLGYVDDKARTLAGITETNTGETNAKNSPVGTTAMLLEQGTKVFTAIHKRIHEAHKNEFKIMAELIEEYMPDEGYPYLLGTSEGTVMPEDFDERVDVLPVSDPNISSNSQRVAKAQSILELQQQYPQIVNEREAVKRMLEAIQVQDIDSLIGTPEDWEKQDKEAADKQNEMEQLEKERMQIETQKLQNEADKIRAEATDSNLQAMKSAFEAAALSTTNEELIDKADALMTSSGFKDYDEEGIMQQQQQQQPMQLPPGQEQQMQQMQQEQGMDPSMMEQGQEYDQAPPEMMQQEQGMDPSIMEQGYDQVPPEMMEPPSEGVMQ